MLPPIRTGCPTLRKAAGRSGWPGPKARVAPLRCTNSSRRPPIGLVGFDLARVVRHVEQQSEIGIGKEMAEDPARVMADDLAVGERAIDGGAHGAEIALADFRFDRRTGELAVGQRDPGRRRRRHHLPQELGADLMAEAARPAMDGHHDLVLFEAKASCGFLVEDLGDRLDLEVVIAGAERAHLAPLAFLGAIGDVAGLRARHLPAFLDAVEIARLAPAAPDRPTGAASKHGVHFEGIEADRAFAAKTGGDLLVQRVGKRPSAPA